MDREVLEATARRSLDAAFRVHSTLGPGLLESAYKACLVYELNKAGMKTKAEVPVPIVYDGTKLVDVGYRIDILIENEIIIEVKAIEAVAPVHCAQLVSYLKLAERRLGFVINFNTVHRQRRNLSAGEWSVRRTQRTLRGNAKVAK